MLGNKKLKRSTSKILLFSGVLFGISLLGSCTSTETLVINTEKPAQIRLPNHIKKIMIVDNSIPQPKDIGHIDYIRGKQSDLKITVETDTLNYSLASNIFEMLADKNHFNEVVFHEHPIRKDADFELIQPLDPNLAKTISSENNVDAIISLDRFLISTLSNEIGYTYGTTIKSLDAKMDVRFRVYSNEGKAISEPLSISDSIYWMSTFQENIPLADTIPSREQAVNEAIQYMAQRIADSLSPYWIEDIRWYYNDVKVANKMLANNNWKGAITAWESAYNKETKNIRKKARIANNIALAYEVSDQLREAIEWISISCELFEETVETSIDKKNLLRAKVYKDELYIRYNDFRLLDMRN